MSEEIQNIEGQDPLTSNEVNEFLQNIQEKDETTYKTFVSSETVRKKISHEKKILEKFDSQKITLTTSLITEWVTNLRKVSTLETKIPPPFLALQKLLLLFYVISRFRNRQNFSTEKMSEILRNFPYHLPDLSKGLFQLKNILLCLKYCALVFRLVEEEKYEVNIETIKEEREVYEKNLFKSLIILLEGSFKNEAKDEMEEEEDLCVILNYTFPLLKYLRNHKKICKIFLMICLKFLRQKRAEKLKNKCFLSIYKIFTLGDGEGREGQKFEIQDFVLRKSYFEFFRMINYYNHKNFERVNYFKNILVELYSLNLTRSYQFVFLFLKQISIYVKNTLQPLTHKPSFNFVLSWKIFKALELWTKIITNFPDKRDQLGELIYPIVTLITCIIKIRSESVVYLPLRLKYVELLHQISRNGSVYIPTSIYLTELFNNDNFVRNKKGLLKAPLNFEFVLRFKEEQVKTKECQKFCFDRIQYLLIEFLSINSRSVSFPELSFPLLKLLKKVYKRDKRDISHYLKFKLKEVINLVKENVQFVVEKRKLVKFEDAKFFAIKEESPITVVFEKMKKEYLTQKLNDLSRFTSVGSGGVRAPRKRKKSKESGKKRKRADDEEEENVDESNIEVIETKEPLRKMRKLLSRKRDVVKKLEIKSFFE